MYDRAVRRSIKPKLEEAEVTMQVLGWDWEGCRRKRWLDRGSNLGPPLFMMRALTTELPTWLTWRNHQLQRESAHIGILFCATSEVEVFGVGVSGFKLPALPSVAVVG